MCPTDLCSADSAAYGSYVPKSDSVGGRRGQPPFQLSPVGENENGKDLRILTPYTGNVDICLGQHGELSAMTRITTSISIYTFPIIGILCLFSASSVQAVSCSNDSLAAFFDRHSKQMDASSKTIGKLDGQFDKLCDYGRKSGTPLWERQLKETAEVVKSCHDPIARSVLLSNRMIFAGYKLGVASDCKHAESLSRSPQNALDYVARGKAFAEKHDYDRAISDFSQAIKLDSNLATAFYNRGGVLYNNKRDAKAGLSDLFEAFRLDPQFGGSDYFANGDNDRKIADNLAITSDAIAGNPDFENPYRIRSAMYFFKGDSDSAIRDASKAVSLYASDDSAFNNRASAYLKKGDVAAAISDLDEAILLNPKVPNYFRNRGIAHLQNGDLERALSDLNEAVRLDPKHQPAFAYRGQVYEKMGQRDNAISDYKSALFLDESNFYNVGLDAYLMAGKRLAVLLNEEQPPK
jgi:tetratricopeptide (TPR) repeat protein